MYIVYEKGTGKVVQALMLEEREPEWKDVIAELPNVEQCAGFSTTDNMEVLTDSVRFEVRKDKSGLPYLFRHNYIVLHFSGDWAVARKWQRIICEDKPTRFTVHFKDELNKPVAVSGELRLDGMNIYISDTHIELKDQTEATVMITGRFPCQTYLEVHFYPTSHIFHPLDREANAGRPVVRDIWRFNVTSRETFLTWSEQPRYDLEIIASDSDADGVKDIVADGNSTVVCMINKKDSKGNVIKDNDLVKITTTHGRLSKEQLCLTDGVGIFNITSSLETVTAQIRVNTDKSNNIIYGKDEIHFRSAQGIRGD